MHDAGLFRDERVELLDGEIVAMGTNGPPHASTVGKVSMLLIPMLAPGPDRAASRYRVARRARPGELLTLPDGSTVRVADLVPRR
jgi:hypothetical protein